MPSYPLLSELPGFIPAAKVGTPQHREMARLVLRDTGANEAFIRQLARLASQHNPTTDIQPCPQKVASNA